MFERIVGRKIPTKHYAFLFAFMKSKPCTVLVFWAWWCIGRVDAFRPEGRGFDSRSSRQVLHLQLPVAFRRVNSDTVSLLWLGALLKGSCCCKHYRNR